MCGNIPHLFRGPVVSSILYSDFIISNWRHYSLSPSLVDSSFDLRYDTAYSPIFSEGKSLNLIVQELHNAASLYYVNPDHIDLYRAMPHYSEYPLLYRVDAGDDINATTLFYRLISDHLHAYLFYFTHFFIFHPLVILLSLFLYFYHYNFFKKCINIIFLLLIFIVVIIFYLNGFFIFGVRWPFYVDLYSTLLKMDITLKQVVYWYENFFLTDYKLRWFLFSYNSHNIYTIINTIMIIIKPIFPYFPMLNSLPEILFDIDGFRVNNYFYKIPYWISCLPDLLSVSSSKLWNNNFVIYNSFMDILAYYIDLENTKIPRSSGLNNRIIIHFTEILDINNLNDKYIEYEIDYKF